MDKWERREEKLQKEKERMKKSGQGMAAMYKNAILKKQKETDDKHSG